MGDYNPDQWPEDIGNEDMRLFKLAGINIVTLPVTGSSLRRNKLRLKQRERPHRHDSEWRDDQTRSK
ncbi:beta-galactosidase [Paenibacillus sp. P26]|nr:beta-galactosidase [Paenibacillus sp. P26]UUZ97368.1 beta-galactosidase [Paenibacillus sp. P25]